MQRPRARGSRRRHRHAAPRSRPIRSPPPRFAARPRHALACIAGLWLRYDFLDLSHHIGQDIENPARAVFGTGSCTAASRTSAMPSIGSGAFGQHPTFTALNTAASQWARESRPARGNVLWRNRPTGTPSDSWTCANRPATNPRRWRPCAERSQQCEWERRFDYSYRQAIGERSLENMRRNRHETLDALESSR